MTSIRILLLVYLFTFLVAPLAVWNFWSATGHNFAMAEMQEKMAHGESHLYGDCSGASIIVPIAFLLYCSLFFIWTIALMAMSRMISRTALIIQTVVVGVLGVIPAVLLDWLFLHVVER